MADRRRSMKSWASGVITQYQSRLESMFGFDLPYDVKVEALSSSDFQQRYEDAGGTGTATAFWDYDTKTIVINMSKARMNDPGFVVHELTHAFQGDSAVPGKKIEGLANYARWKLGLTPPGWTLNQAAARFADMNPQQIKRVMQRQSTIDSPANAQGQQEDADAARGAEGGVGRALNGIVKDLMADLEPGAEAGRRDLAFTVATLYKNSIDAGNSKQDTLRFLRQLAVSRSGTQLFWTGIGDPSIANAEDITPILNAPKKGDGDGGGGGGGGNGTWVDIDGDGVIDPGETFGGGGGEDELSKRDYLGQLSGVPITREIRQLAIKAAEEGWTTTEFNYEVSKTDTYFRDSSIGYKGILQEFGISGGNLDSLMRKAVRSGYSESEFLYFLRKTPEYRERFRGIFKKDGTMRMTEGEYLQFEFGLQTLGKSYGYKVDGQDVGEALRKGQSLESFEDRLSALQRVREYEPAMKSFVQTLRARGELPKGAKDWGKQDMYEFVTGQKDPRFYRIWEEASARTAAYVAGIDVLDKKEAKTEPGGVGYTDLRRGAIMKIIKQLPGYQTEEELAAGFQQLGDSLLEVLPLSEARTYGLTKQDLIKATFGGKNAARARQRVKRVIETHEAFQEDRANTRFGVDESGRAGIEQGRGFADQSEY